MKIRTRTFVFLIWGVFLAALLLPTLLFFAVARGLFGPLPETKVLENPKTPLATEIYSEDGRMLGKYFSANRSPATFEDLSPHLVKALQATEDIRYTQHAGIDFQVLPRILVKTVILRQESGGGSTVTQQLAKNLFPRQNLNKWRLVVRKLQEWVIAVRLERLYTKEEIMAMYFNVVDFNHLAVGINSASKIYFNKTPDKLDILESATIVGMLKNPTLFNPKSHPDQALSRRNVVMSQMVKYGYLPQEEYAQLKTQPIELTFATESHTQGLATYFREHLRKWLERWARENNYDIYGDGLRVYTTIDSRMQAHAEQAVAQHMKETQAQFYKQFTGNKKPWSNVPEIIDLTVKRSERYRVLKKLEVSEEQIAQSFSQPVKMRVFTWQGDKDTVMSPLDSIKHYKYILRAGFMAMNPSDGAIKAWVGGVNFKHLKYDHVLGKRQVGSTFKPIVYAATIMNKHQPCMEVLNEPVYFAEYDNWSPKNSDGKYGNVLTLKQGLAQSVNCVTAYAMKELTSTHQVVNLAQRMGIHSKLEPVPSLCLGTADISLIEMVGAFNTFSNNGVYVEPVFVTRIEDKNGTILYQKVPKTVEVMDEKYSYVMVDMLKGVTNGSLWGTASRLRYKYNLRGPMGGKTGTTQNNSDAWFIGIVPQLSGGVWVGAEDRAVHFESTVYGQGAALALPIWAYFLQKVYADQSLDIDADKDWERPVGDLPVELDCRKVRQSQGEVMDNRPPSPF